MFDAGALLLLFVFAILFSMLLNGVGPKFMTYAASKSWGAKLNGNYAGRTALTAIMVFAFLVAVSIAMSAVDKKPSLPSA